MRLLFFATDWPLGRKCHCLQRRFFNHEAVALTNDSTTTPSAWASSAEPYSALLRAKGDEDSASVD